MTIPPYSGNFFWYDYTQYGYQQGYGTFNPSGVGGYGVQFSVYGYTSTTTSSTPTGTSPFGDQAYQDGALAFETAVTEVSVGPMDIASAYDAKGNFANGNYYFGPNYFYPAAGWTVYCSVYNLTFGQTVTYTATYPSDPSYSSPTNYFSAAHQGSMNVLMCDGAVCKWPYEKSGLGNLIAFDDKTTPEFD